MKIIEVQPNTDAFEEAIRGYVRAERINDCIAGTDTKRYQEYLRLIRDQVLGEPVVDPSDEFRERELVPRALDAYERKHGVNLTTGCVYFSDDFPICAAPEAVESDLIGITVHIRSSYGTYREAVERGITADMYRHSIAMMAVTQLEYWIHLQYLEEPSTLTRKMHEHEVEFSKGRADDLMGQLIAFALKSRYAAEASAA